MAQDIETSLVRSLSLMVSLVAFAVGCETTSAGPGQETTAAACSDGVDNDLDQLFDCEDMDCAPYCSDGGVDGDADADVEPPDADGPADGSEPDGSDGGGAADGDPDGTPDDPDGDLDEGPTEPTRCDEASPCAEATLLCYDFFLDGATICAPRGPSCVRNGDCPPSTVCGEIAGWPEGGWYCRVAEERCSSSLACPDGFRCEGGACTDRRRACVNNLDCPRWGSCTSLRSGLRVCLPGGGPIPCTDDESCGGSFVCVDVDGDGDRECQEGGGTCLVNADCEGGVCGDADGAPGAECGAVGPCLVTEDCPPGHLCLDADGDGALECQPEGGACTRDADCPARTLCFDGDAAEGAECL